LTQWLSVASAAACARRKLDDGKQFRDIAPGDRFVDLQPAAG
jgi:hypothetical protein